MSKIHPPCRVAAGGLLHNRAAKDRGTRVYTIGLGGSQDASAWLLAASASQPSMAYLAPDSGDLAVIHAEIARREVRCD